MNVMSYFLEAEINSQELYEEIFRFVISYHIRNGELEGNEFILKKMDENNFIIFPEYYNKEGKREIHYSLSVYKKQLIEEIQKEAEKNGLNLLNEE